MGDFANRQSDPAAGTEEGHPRCGHITPRLQVCDLCMCINQGFRDSIDVSKSHISNRFEIGTQNQSTPRHRGLVFSFYYALMPLPVFPVSVLSSQACTINTESFVLFPVLVPNSSAARAMPAPSMSSLSSQAKAGEAEGASRLACWREYR